jgi:hypothetical protein
MRTKLLLVVFLVFSVVAGYGQTTDRKFGVEANQFIIQSGFGTSTEIQVFVQDNHNRRLSLGTYFDNKFQTIGGISVSFYKMLRNYKKSTNTTLDPYLFYNFIYRKTTITETEITENSIVNIGTYKSMEHHIGIGLRTNITKRFYIKGEIGYGLYLGSIMKPSKPDPVLNESYGTNGTGAILKIGTGIFF